MLIFIAGLSHRLSKNICERDFPFTLFNFGNDDNLRCYKNERNFPIRSLYNRHLTSKKVFTQQEIIH